MMAYPLFGRGCLTCGLLTSVTCLQLQNKYINTQVQIVLTKYLQPNFMTFGKYILGSNIWIHRDDFTSYDFMPKIWCKQLKSLGIISKLNQSLQARAWQAGAWEQVYHNKLQDDIWFDLPFLAFYWHYKWVRWSREGSFLNPIYTLNTPKKMVS